MPWYIMVYVARHTTVMTVVMPWYIMGYVTRRATIMAMVMSWCVHYDILQYVLLSWLSNVIVIILWRMLQDTVMAIVRPWYIMVYVTRRTTVMAVVMPWYIMVYVTRRTTVMAMIMSWYIMVYVTRRATVMAVVRPLVHYGVCYKTCHCHGYGNVLVSTL